MMVDIETSPKRRAASASELRNQRDYDDQEPVDDFRSPTDFESLDDINTSSATESQEPPRTAGRLMMILKLMSAEFLGTIILMILGMSGSASLRLKEPSAEYSLYAPILWGLSLTCAYHAVGGISGGHFNPAMTLSLLVAGKFPLDLTIPYLVAQQAATMLAAFITFWLFDSAFTQRFGSAYSQRPEMASLYSPQPHGAIGSVTLFVDSVVASLIFAMIVNAITDERNGRIPRGLYALYIGLIGFSGVIFALGYNWSGGGSFNPARDMGPKVVVGWFCGVRYKHVGYTLLSMFGSFVGAICGSVIYQKAIGNLLNSYPEGLDSPAPVGRVPLYARDK